MNIAISIVLFVVAFVLLFMAHMHYTLGKSMNKNEFENLARTLVENLNETVNFYLKGKEIHFDKTFAAKTNIASMTIVPTSTGAVIFNWTNKRRSNFICRCDEDRKVFSSFLKDFVRATKVDEEELT